MRILLLSGYDAQSHQFWRKGLVDAFPQYDWQVLTLPARFFQWRIRGNPYSWLSEFDAELREQYDCLITTSMVDVATLKGLIPSLASVRTLIYFHENQCEYPQGQGGKHRIEPIMVNLYNLLCADTVIFNSEYNRQSCYQGLKSTLKKMPDLAKPKVLDAAFKRACVLPVPLNNVTACVRQQQKNSKLVITWNHRWEYDKGPDRLLALVMQLDLLHLPVIFNVVGQSFRQLPPEFQLVKRRLEEAGVLGCWGYIESSDAYHALLARTDIVLSTSVHDFQGLSILEAVQCGAIPVVPKRMAYAEMLGERYCYPVSENVQQEAEFAQKALVTAINTIKSGSAIAPQIAHLTWANLQSAYQTVIEGRQSLD